MRAARSRRSQCLEFLPLISSCWSLDDVASLTSCSCGIGRAAKDSFCSAMKQLSENMTKPIKHSVLYYDGHTPVLAVMQKAC